MRSSFNIFIAAFAFSIALSVEGGAQAAKPAPVPRKPDPSLVQINDVPGLPRVLLIGDSISMGYTVPVRELLTGKANVHRIPTNGGWTTMGLQQLDRWLGDGKWDVIHFNWGLHDLRYVPNGGRNVPPDLYEKNLREIVKRLKATGAKLIWCSTTPVPERAAGPERKPEDVINYNAIANRVMDENGVEINDLYAFALPKLAEIQLPKNVHFSAAGSAELAKPVAKSIEAALPSK